MKECYNLIICFYLTNEPYVYTVITVGIAEWWEYALYSTDAVCIFVCF